MFIDKGTASKSKDWSERKHRDENRNGELKMVHR